jgi:hypothetical protein
MFKQSITAADESKADLQPIDIIVIVAVALFIAAGAFVLLRTMCTKVQLAPPPSTAASVLPSARCF